MDFKYKLKNTLGVRYRIFERILSQVPELLDHSLRTAELVYNISPSLTRTPPELLSLGGYLHDLGKINWPGELQYKRNLSVVDWSQIQMHPIYGLQILQALWPEIPLELRTVRWIIEGHHERPEGKGYPNGIYTVPDDIAIVAACESYDAMTKPRQYRDNPMSHRQAIMELKAWCPEKIIQAISELEHNELPRNNSKLRGSL